MSCEREAQIRALLPIVRRIAARVRRLVAGVELDDLIGDGCVGLIRAVDSYDARRGTTLAHYARRLIVGAMLNGIRRMDPVSERARRAVRDGENERYAIAASRGDVPSLAEMDRRRPGYLRACLRATTGQPLSLDAPLPEGQSQQIDWSGDPALVAERRSRRAALAAAVERLTPRQRSVLVLHYYGERSLRAVGRELAISAQRASQLHVAALARLRESSVAASR
ncbi:MAG TPA: sigma-70 family RNA polymerase sigma factor [Verrucomicrobiae bacterium]|nr:sigma-70 family RNA polymerase sigma factor [Verrucomicrobiae bacterium]